MASLFFEAVVLVIGFNFIFGQKDVLDVKYKSICNEDTVYHLQGTGIESSLTLRLAAAEKNNCSIKITAPDTHVIYVKLADLEQVTDVPVRKHLVKDSCPVNVYTTESTRRSSWLADACRGMSSSESELLVHKIEIVWQPPKHIHSYKERQLIITALGKGESCEAENQHVCLPIGWQPVLCVAQELVCDGVMHCPPGSQLDDEFCRDKQILAAANWERIANDFLLKFTGKSRSGNLLPAIESEETKWLNQFKKNANTLTSANVEAAEDGAEQEADAPNGISAALSHYGPWGYLMLGMLICGTVLMFCGLWECCCRRPKPHTEATPSSLPPTTVLIINTPTEDAQTPPRYEDLDQPPSYDALFPHDQSKNSCSAVEAEFCGTRPQGVTGEQARE